MLARPVQDGRGLDGPPVAPAGRVAHAGEKTTAAVEIACVRGRDGAPVHERVAERDVPGVEGIQLGVEDRAAALERLAVRHAPERYERLGCSPDTRRAADQR